MTRRSSFRSAHVIGCLAILLATAGTAGADCTNETLKGAYGFSIAGTNYVRDAAWALVGQFQSDGAGNISGTGMQSTKGFISPSKFGGTYQVNADCSGTATFSFAQVAKAALYFVIVDSGKRVEMIVADQGVLETGSATKVTTDPTPAAATAAAAAKETTTR